MADGVRYLEQALAIARSLQSENRLTAQQQVLSQTVNQTENRLFVILLSID